MKSQRAQKRREGGADSHLHQSEYKPNPKRHAHRWALLGVCKEKGGGPEVASEGGWAESVGRLGGSLWGLDGWAPPSPKQQYPRSLRTTYSGVH